MSILIKPSIFHAEYKMKHIEKRFLFQKTTEEFNLNSKEFEIIDVKAGNANESIKSREGEYALLETNNGYILGSFIHKVDGNGYAFPIPDPTLIYFNYSQLNITQIKDRRKELLKKLDLSSSLSEPAINEIYAYYGLTSTTAILLFTAVESFINQQIPEGYIFKMEKSRATEHYNRKQIQQYLDFSTKIKQVLTDVTGKNFFQKQTTATQHIENLKQFRDSIIHTKQGDNPSMYDHIIKKSLSFKYEESLIAVANFMNFYKPNYIVECGCGADY